MKAQNVHFPINTCNKHANLASNNNTCNSQANIVSNKLSQNKLLWADCTNSPNSVTNITPNINNSSSNTNTMTNIDKHLLSINPYPISSLLTNAPDLGEKDSLGEWHFVKYKKSSNIAKRKNSEVDSPMPSIDNAKNSNSYKFAVGSADNDEIKAAKTLIKKSYLYIGNVNVDLDIEELRNYLTKRKINILALYKLNKKNGKNDDQAFKLVVEKYQFKEVAKPSFWPKNFLIKRWQFRQATTNNTEPPQKKLLTSTSLDNLKLIINANKSNGNSMLNNDNNIIDNTKSNSDTESINQNIQMQNEDNSNTMEAGNINKNGS